MTCFRPVFSIMDRHNAVRNSVGVFDVSHMGEIEIHGPEAAKLTDFVTTNNVQKLKHGQAHYSGPALQARADLWTIFWSIKWRTTAISCASTPRTRIRMPNISARTTASMRKSGFRRRPLARRSPFQGLNHRATLQRLTPVDLAAIKYYWFTDGIVGGILRTHRPHRVHRRELATRFM